MGEEVNLGGLGLVFCWILVTGGEVDLGGLGLVFCWVLVIGGEAIANSGANSLNSSVSGVLDCLFVFLFGLFFVSREM